MEAEISEKPDFKRAQGIRNGLMIAILALTQIRLRNFVALEIRSTFKEVNGSWWISVPAGSTKNKRWIEKRIPNSFNHVIELYLNWARPILTRSIGQDNSLWISSRTGRRFTYKNLGTLISKITFRTLGVDVSPHLFRTAAASTAAVKIPEFPHLASALLGHVDSRVTDEYYKRTTSLNAGKLYADLIQEYANRVRIAADRQAGRTVEPARARDCSVFGCQRPPQDKTLSSAPYAQLGTDVGRCHMKASRRPSGRLNTQRYRGDR